MFANWNIAFDPREHLSTVSFKMPRNKKKNKKAVPEPPDETPNFLNGYVSDDHIVLLGVDPSSSEAEPQPLILPIETINYILLRGRRGPTYIYRVGIADGVSLDIHNNQGPVDFGEMIFPGEYPDADEDPWEPRRGGRS